MSNPFFPDLGAADESEAPPWQQHLSGLGPVLDIPSLGGGGIDPREAQLATVSGGISAQEFERLINPRMTEGLQLAQSQHQSAQDRVRALGLSEDVDDEATPGLLTKAFRFIDYPRAVTFNAFRTLLDPEMDAPEFREAVARREGFGDLEALKQDEDDGGLERFWKGAAAFAGDVATDPLNLMLFGAMPAGKKLASTAIHKAVSNRAGSLSDDVLRSVQQRALKAEARVASERAGAELSEDAVKEITKQFGDMPVPGMVGDMAAEAYQLEGATGLRTFLEGLGDQGKNLWGSLPTEMRGGLRIRIPFAREEQVRMAVALGGGGGKLAEGLGLSRLVKTTHQARNMVRTSRVGKAMSNSINGAYGDLYAEVAADVVQRGADDISGLSWRQYRTARAARAKAEDVREKIMTSGSATAARITERLENAGSKDEVATAWDNFIEWASHPDHLKHLEADPGLEIDELGRILTARGQGPYNRPQLLGISAAAEYHHLLRTLHAEAIDAGADIGTLEDYLPLVLTEVRKDMRNLKKAGISRKSGSMKHGLDPSQKREMGFDLVPYVDEDGVSRTRIQPLSPRQVNERVKERARRVDGEVDPETYFEEDLGVMLQQYTQALSHIASEARFARVIKASGLAREGDRELVDVGLRNRTAGKSVEAVEKALDDLRDFSELGEPPEGTDVFNALKMRNAVLRVMHDAEAQREVITRALWDPDLGPEDQSKIARDVLSAMDRWQDELMPLTEAHDKLEAAQKSFKTAQAKLARSARPDVQAGEAGRALHELGLQPVGQSVTDKLRKIPPELSTSFAPEALRDTISKFYKMTGKRRNDVLDRWYRPYHSMFKITATIGRGPGFHIRNAVGGTVNNMMYGATPEDTTTMAKITKAMMSSKQQAKRDIASEATEASLERGKLKATPGYWDEVSRRTEAILEPRLREIEVTPDTNGWQAYRMMVDQGDVVHRQGRSYEALEVAGQRGLGPADPEARSIIGHDIYPGLEPEDLSTGQRAVVGLRNLGWIRMNATAAEMTEAWLRGTAFIHGLKQYGDPEIAKIGTMITQFDYHDLSEFEARWMRGSLLPFYSWIRNNLPFQLRTLMQRPGQMNKINLLVENARDTLGDEDADILPEWMRERFGFVSRFKFGGNPLMFGVEAPAQDLNEFFKVGGSGAALSGMGKAFLGAMNPALSVPLQLFSGTEFFTGAPLEEGTQRIAPAWYQALSHARMPGFPTWVDPETGDVHGDARKIVSGNSLLPWLNQGEKLLAMASHAAGGQPYPEARNRAVSDAIRQFFPVMTAGTLTPQSETGELFQRTQRLRTRSERQADPEDQRTITVLQEMGFSLEEIAAIMESRS